MAAFEVICTLAATLWIGFVAAALGIGYRVMAKLRSRRRRINRLLDVVRSPLGFGRRDARHLRWRDRVLRYYGVPPRRSGIAGHYGDLVAVLRGITPERLIAPLVALEVSRNLQRRNEYR